MKPLVPEISVEATFNKSDLITIAVAKGERILRQNLIDKRKEASEIKEKISENKAAQDKALKSLQGSYELQAAALNKITRKLDPEAIFITNTSIVKPYDYEKREEATKNRFAISFRNYTIAQKDTNLTKEQKSLRAKAKTLAKALSKAQNDALDVKRKISDIASLERQMRARMMEAQLKSTKEGKALLDQLLKESGIDSSIKLLGL